MKSTLLSLILTIVFLINCVAQQQEAHFKVSIPDASNNKIFDENPDIEHIQLNYRDDEVTKISLRNKDGRYANTFYTYFEGDCYILGKKFPGLILPQAPKLDVTSFNNIKNLRDSAIKIEVFTNIKRDTIVHNFYYSIIENHIFDFERPKGNSLIIRTYKLKDSSTRSDTGYFAHPEPKGNISRFGKALSQLYKQWKPIAVEDSAIIVGVMVEKTGSLSDVQLQIGRSSAFSDRVLEFIKQEVKEWWPMYIDSVSKVRSGTRIFVRLNRDETVTFVTL